MAIVLTRARQFIALVKLQKSKKKKAAKSADDFTERFKASIKDEEEALKKQVEELSQAAYVLHILHIEGRS